MDRVVVSDILHEYTEPAAPTGLSLDTSVEGEITASFTVNATFLPSKGFHDGEYKVTSASTWNEDGYGDVNPRTTSGLTDGTTYDYRVRGFLYQDRRGQFNSDSFQSSFISTTATTILPPVTNAQVESIDGDRYNLSWDGTANNGTYTVLISATGGSSFVQDGNTVQAPTLNTMTTEYNSANEHVIKIQLSTEHVSKETATINGVLAGSVVKTTNGVSDHEQDGIIMTDKE